MTTIQETCVPLADDALPSERELCCGPAACDAGQPPTRARRRSVRGSRGMTLIEIIVVVAIITLVVGGASVMAINALNKSRIDTAANETIKVQNLVEMYMVQKRNKCPKTMQDLVAAGIASKASKDPWGNEYVIKCPGETASVDVISAGPDGEPGTEDDIANYSELADDADEDAKN